MVKREYYICQTCGSDDLEFIKKDSRGKENKKWYCLNCKKRVFVKSIVK